MSDRLSRIDKLFLDRDGARVDEARARRARYRVTLACGADVVRSRTLQLSVLTAAAIASRCFPGAVHVGLDKASFGAPLIAWPMASTFKGALEDIVGAEAISPLAPEGLDEQTVVFGDTDAPASALRVTFDGWVAEVGPYGQVRRRSEREFNPLAGMLGAALALSEVFLSFAELSLEARRRVVGLSLWRPDLSPDDPAALGVPVEYLPSNLWVLGLGHLGTSFLWALAGLPHACPESAEIALLDFDKIEPENFETGLLYRSTDQGQRKTRVCSRWLEERGFRTRLVERRFDSTFRCQHDQENRELREPRLALCGFDSNAARRDLPAAGFAEVVESGLGGTARNFDTIALHTWPNPRPAAELWPDLSEDQQKTLKESEERMVRGNPGYASLGKDDCGRALLAGKAVAVPFVGATAACLVVSEVLRLAHDGAHYTDAKLRLGRIDPKSFRAAGMYRPEDAAFMSFLAARPLL